MCLSTSKCLKHYQTIYDLKKDMLFTESDRPKFDSSCCYVSNEVSTES